MPNRGLGIRLHSFHSKSPTLFIVPPPKARAAFQALLTFSGHHRAGAAMTRITRAWRASCVGKRASPTMWKIRSPLVQIPINVGFDNWADGGSTASGLYRRQHSTYKVCYT